MRLWWIFCQEPQIPSFLPEVDQVLNFLFQEVQNIGFYSTFNIERSAISLISDKAIGNHLLIKRFAKDISVIKPQRPHYDFIWDPAPVITKLAKIFPYDLFTLETVTKKLILLLALGSGQRECPSCA